MPSITEAVVAVTRTSLTAQYLSAASHQSRLAFQIEAKPVAEVSEEDRIAHVGFVVGAILQATAALESEIWEVMTHGPGHHLGSNHIDLAGRDLLAPLAEMIDDEPILRRYDVVLHLLRKTALDRGAQPCQDAALVVRLRNELVHYKSRWSNELERSTFLDALRKKGHPRPSFQPAGLSFFPQHCLSAACAAWVVDSAVAYLDAFYLRIGVKSPLEGRREWLSPRPPRLG